MRDPTLRPIARPRSDDRPLWNVVCGLTGLPAVLVARDLKLFPPPADLHLYADIFHDWPPERCRFLARKSFASLPSGGRVLVHEMLLDDDKTGPFAAAAYSVAMLIWTQGQQHSGAEIAAILRDAGFVDVAITPTTGYWSVVAARKP